jgi:hypothetical protein
MNDLKRVTVAASGIAALDWLAAAAGLVRDTRSHTSAVTTSVRLLHLLAALDVHKQVSDSVVQNVCGGAVFHSLQGRTDGGDGDIPLHESRND